MNGGESYLKFLPVAGFQACGVAAYFLASGSQWASAAVGSIVGLLVGYAVLAFWSPEVYLRDLRRKGASLIMRRSPVGLTALIGGSYVLFQDLLQPPAVWGTIAFVGILVGLLALVRTLSAVVPDD